MKDRMTIEYLKCRADLNIEVDFRVNDTIATIATKWDLIFFGKESFLLIMKLFFIIQLNVFKCLLRYAVLFCSASSIKSF